MDDWGLNELNMTQELFRAAIGYQWNRGFASNRLVVKPRSELSANFRQRPLSGFQPPLPLRMIPPS